MENILNNIGMILYRKNGLSKEKTLLKLELKTDFEGFYRRASEDMEYQWQLQINNKIFESNRFENIDDFLLRIKAKII